MTIVNRELLIYCLQSIAQQGPWTIEEHTLIQALSYFQGGIELVEERQHLKTYKVGNMAFRIYCYANDGFVSEVELFEKDRNNKVYYIGLSVPVFFNETDVYPDCLK